MTDRRVATAGEAAAFYTRIAGLYDLVARRTPGVGRLRTAFAEALAPPTGATVVEFGCGTGANAPYLGEQLGPEGRYVGVDLSAGVLARARAQRGAGMAFVRGDAVNPPIDTVDAVCASFVSGMLTDPAGTVRDWVDLVGPGGRVALLDLARSTGPGRPLNPAFRLLVRASAPPRSWLSIGRDLTTELDERVVAAHRALREACTDASYETRWLGFARLSAGRVPE